MGWTAHHCHASHPPRRTTRRRGAPGRRPAWEPAGSDERLALLLTAARLNVGLGLLALVRDEAPTYQLAGPALLAVAAATTPSAAGTNDRRARRDAALELAATAAAVVLTGGLNSPLGTRGCALDPPRRLSLRRRTRSARRHCDHRHGRAITLQPDDSSTPRVIALVGVVDLMCGALGAFTRRRVQEIGEQHTEVLKNRPVSQEANGLLVALHGSATMPATLDLDEVMTSVRTV